MSGGSHYRIETPEQIEVEFELAGLGSRFCAAAIDTLLMVAAIAALGLIALLLGGSYLAMVHDRVGPRGEGLAQMPIWALSLLVALLLTIPFGGYFIVFELVMRGQTPGKRAMRLRAIRDDGTPMATTDVLVRNLYVSSISYPPSTVSGWWSCSFTHSVSGWATLPRERWLSKKGNSTTAPKPTRNTDSGRRLTSLQMRV